MGMQSMRKTSFSTWAFWTVLLLVGGFHEYISCVLAAVLSGYLLWRLSKKKTLKIRKDLLTSAIVAVCFGYGLTCIWGVDKGMAFVGFLKFLPLLLYLICLQQEENAGQALEMLPYYGVVLAVISAVGMQFPAVQVLFSVAGRLAGTFQYPNTFAIFLLVCQLLLIKKGGKTAWDYVALLVLVAGFLYTGSRTAFVVGLLSHIAMLLTMTKKKVRLIALGVLGGIVVICMLLALDPDSVLRRYLTISLTESTFVGRLLYWVDALPLLLKAPFGMGYMGYFYTQQSIQTGVYTVTYIHNDLLQLLLDIGWAPVALLVAAIIGWLCKKEVPSADKIILGAVCLHSLFDFNLQFVGVFMLLLILLSAFDPKKELVLQPGKLLKTGFAAVMVVGLYMGAALMLAHFGQRELSDTMYPYNTNNQLSMLEQEQDLEKADDLAEKILRHNSRFYAPYSIRARYYYSKGDFGTMIQYARAALERSPFQQSEYENYCKMLITGIDLYEKNGDAQSAQICRQELISVYRQFLEMPQRLSPLGKRIKDQPIGSLDPQITDYIRQLSGG